MNRRRFLKGLASATIALPLLESLPGSKAFAQTAGSPRRFVCFFQCNGANMSTFWPQGAYGALTDAHFPADRALYPLRAYRDKLLIPRNLHMSPKGFGADQAPGCDHQKGMGHKLTGRLLDGAGFAQGISIDQYIANQINPAARAALTLGVHRTGGGGTGSISYRGAGAPVTSEPNPRLAFQDLMCIDYGDTVTADLLTTRRKSVLDLVRSDFEALSQRSLSKSDRDKLDLHFTTIRELELALNDPTTGGVAGLQCTPLDAARVSEIMRADQGTDVLSDASFKRVGRMQMDLIALALACDHTRSATLQWGVGAGGPIFNWDGISHQYNHHKLSHGNTRDDDSGSAVAGYQQMLLDIDRWFAGELAYLLDRMSAYTEVDGSLLDHSCVLWINELSDGKDHDFRDLPCVIAGGAGGALRTGQYVNLSRYADARQTGFGDLDAPHNKLLTTLVNAVGAGPIEHFGDPAYGASGQYDALLR